MSPTSAPKTTNPGPQALPPELSRLARSRIDACIEAARGNGIYLPDENTWPGDSARVFACSEFVANCCEQQPGALRDLLVSGDLAASLSNDAESNGPVPHFQRAIDRSLAAGDTPAELMAPLRRLRRREWLRIAWRDIGGLATLEETVRDTSAFAEAALFIALERLHGRLSHDLGVPESSGGEPQRMSVLALGKLGAGELNFSSDIDLIFGYPASGQTRGKRRSYSNDEYFQRLARQLIKTLGERTEDGFVFRVDMRLRPFGTGGSLVMSFNALEDYYQVHGRDWERYALIRARPVAGDMESGDALIARLRPFVYRRYLDFGSLESMREMKSMINKEVERKGLDSDLKLGPGGIREIEFTGQAFQMVRGGRIPELRDRRILKVLAVLAQRDLLPAYAVEALTSAYRFLRTSEHRLQQMQDRQIHELPSNDDDRLTLAAGMGFTDWNAYLKTLEKHRSRVNSQFTQVLGAEDRDRENGDGGADRQLIVLLGEDLSEDVAARVLESAGFEAWREARELIDHFRQSFSVRMLDKPGAARLRRLFPDLLRAVASQREPVVALGRVLEVVETVARRSAYLALLAERPLALSQLVRLCAASPWISRHLGRHPLLFDELLDARSLYAPLKREALESELKARLLEIAAGDTEQELACLRQFKQANVLRVAAADIAAAIPLMVVSDYLTEIAETVLGAALGLASRDLVARYGTPTFGENNSEALPFAVIGYGKLGGIELGYGSDLDLVFIHGGEHEGFTSGERSVDNSVFFGRLAQRTIHFLTALTGDGSLYEVDSRLRPDGNKGLLVNGISALETYLREKAWTWEHQALVRARAITGEPAVAREFAAMRRRILLLPRDPEELRKDVKEMRQRMRSELGSSDKETFDLKQDAGGIADIEFMVQYGALCWPARLGDHLDYTDNIRLLEGFSAVGIMPDDEVQLLKDAYRAYRARVHELALQEQDSVIAAGEFGEFRKGVSRIWQKLMGV